MGLRKITILATTDVHSNIWGYNYEKNEEMKECGMANLYSYIKEVRKNNPNTILLDNGDMIQGSLMTDELFNKGWMGEHPISKVMNYMKYDAMTMGNHEFNVHLSLLKRFIDETEFPVMSANTKYKSSNQCFAQPYSIIERDGIRIGIIGLTTPGVPTWVGNKVEELTFHALGEIAYKYVKEIKDKVDAIVVMCHSSLDGELDYNKDAARNVLDLCPDIDILVVGHFHITVNTQIGKALVGGTTDKGREIMHFDLFFDENNKIVSKTIQIVDMKEFNPSEEIREIPLIKEAHKKTIELANGKVLGVATKNFQPPNEINWIPQGRLQETPLIQLINKVQLINSGADVSATSLIREYSDIHQGNITYGTICSVYKFDTLLYVVELSIKELKAYMEWTASAYNQWKPGDMSISFSSNIPGYQHDFFSGINFNIDLSKEVGSRIVNFNFKGKTLKDQDLIKLAVSDYCYNTTLRGKGFTQNEPIWKSNKLIKEMLVDYIMKEKFIKPELDENWMITGVDLLWSTEVREEIIKKVNSGEIEIPYNKSLNIHELKEMGY